MDSITHIVLGATLGEVLAGKSIGKKAMLNGAVAQSLPDFDFIAGAWMSPPEYFLAHRGFTHSFLFAALASLILPLIVNYFRSTKINFTQWSIFFLIQIVLHDLIDSLNAYGVGWFEPFSHTRISFDVLFVVDPLLTMWTGISAFILIILPAFHRHRIKLAVAAILLSVVYATSALNNKVSINKTVNQAIVVQKIPSEEFLTTPTPLNSVFWYIVVRSNEGYYIGYHSVLDTKPSIAFQFLPANDSLLNPYRQINQARQLIRLSRRYYALEQRKDTLVFSNLRFGQMNGWENPKAGFVFQYNIGRSDNSLLTVQRGRFSGWSKKTFLTFWARIKGD